jgi:SAM-dependent methyltransferase
VSSIAPKPAHLTQTYAEQFRDASVVAAYLHRPPYPDAIFAMLIDLAIGGAAATVLDVGAGRGEIARDLAQRVARVDAVEPSPAMVAAGRSLPGGDSPNLRWIEATAEDAPLDPPYGLVVAAASLHWMEWSVVLPRFRAALAPGGMLAIVGVGEGTYPWSAALQDVIDHHSTNRDFRPYDIVEELESRGLFRTVGRRTTDPVLLARSIADYVESFHARNGFSRDRMTPNTAAAFDAEATALVTPQAENGIVLSDIVGTVVWGEPAPLHHS